MEGDLPPLSPSESLALCKEGGVVVTLGVREGERVGVDLRSYAVGPSFQGFKMIPPSCTHLLTFGESERLVGMFLTLPPGGVSVLEYDPSTELPAPLPASPKLDGIAHSVRRMEWDARLGPYPIATSAQWSSLSSQITGGVLERAGIPFGSLVLPGGIDDDSLTCPELTRSHLDPSDLVNFLLESEYGGGGEDNGGGEAGESALVGELQLAFVLFLQLSSLRALQQWKMLVHTIFKCEALLTSRPSMYTRFLSALRAQLHFAPSDFFEDELSADNFLRSSLATLVTLSEGHTLDEQASHFVGSVQQPANFPQVSQL
ncbi:MAG: hypothetical protein SGPRY_002820 [Prymnesium sp.]